MSDGDFRDMRRSKMREDNSHKVRRSNGEPRKPRIDPYDRGSRHNVHQALDRYKHLDFDDEGFEYD